MVSPKKCSSAAPIVTPSSFAALWVKPPWGVTKVAGGAGVVNGKTEAASSQNAAATGGFCCYRGKSFAKDMCIWDEIWWSNGYKRYVYMIYSCYPEI